MKPIGIGILAYYGLDDLQHAVAGIREYTRTPYVGLVFDNSEDFGVGQWVMHHAAEMHYVRSPFNVLCAQSRNRMAEWFLARGIERFILMDQDVRPAADAWDADMLAVLSGHPDTGIVGWELATRQMGPGYKPDATGRVPELPGACNLYTAECVKAAGGWCPEYPAYRFDSDFCLVAGTKGFKTRVVWPDTGKIRHDRPHRGVDRHPRMQNIRRHSQLLFERRGRELGFQRVPL